MVPGALGWILIIVRKYLRHPVNTMSGDDDPAHTMALLVTFNHHGVRWYRCELSPLHFGLNCVTRTYCTQSRIGTNVFLFIFSLMLYYLHDSSIAAALPHVALWGLEYDRV